MASKNRGSRRSPRKLTATKGSRPVRTPRPAPAPAPRSSGVLFVIMPFGLVLDHVFETQVRPAAEAAGYEVARADTTLNQRAIMKDIAEGIRTAKIVVADLTGRNANVFYELGLAHAIGRDSILLAQSTNDIPFDLKAYRAVIYGLSFDASGLLSSSLRGDLQPILEAASRGGVVFGNPFTDFADITPGGADDEVESEGALESIARFMETDMPQFVASLEQLSELMEEFGEKQTPILARLDEAPKGKEVQHAIEVTNEWAAALTTYADRIAPVVDDEFIPSALRIETAAIATIRLGRLGTDASVEESTITSLEALGQTCATVAVQAREFGGLLKQLAPITTSMREPAKRVSTMFDRIAVTLERVAGLPVTLREMP